MEERCNQELQYKFDKISGAKNRRREIKIPGESEIRI